jgi:hypothetical protein
VALPTVVVGSTGIELHRVAFGKCGLFIIDAHDWSPFRDVDQLYAWMLMRLRWFELAGNSAR